MILNGDDGGLGAKRTVTAFEKKMIGKFERLRYDKENFLRSAKLDDRFLQW